MSRCNSQNNSSSSNKRPREEEEEKEEKKDASMGAEREEPEAKKCLKFENIGVVYDELRPLILQQQGLMLVDAPAVPPPRRFMLREITSCYCDKRRTNDEIHSSVQLGPVLTAILDTPPMQRLRGLSQLGTAEFVFVNANHNRFEHSLGVALLAETLCQKIRKNQPSLRCTAKDVLCVQLAGECMYACIHSGVYFLLLHAELLFLLVTLTLIYFGGKRKDYFTILATAPFRILTKTLCSSIIRNT